MTVPLLDLVAQYQTIKNDVLAALMTVIERQGFIMGPEVARLEAEIARLSHELEMARQSGAHPASLVVGEIETHLARARELMSGEAR